MVLHREALLYTDLPCERSYPLGQPWGYFFGIDRRLHPAAELIYLPIREL